MFGAKIRKIKKKQKQFNLKNSSSTQMKGATVEHVCVIDIMMLSLLYREL